MIIICIWEHFVFLKKNYQDSVKKKMPLCYHLLAPNNKTKIILILIIIIICKNLVIPLLVTLPYSKLNKKP